MKDGKVPRNENMPTYIKLNNCKCGEKLVLREGEEWSGMRVRTAYSCCPKRRWFNFWKHNKNTTHAYMPYPSVNKWKPGVKKQFSNEK